MNTDAERARVGQSFMSGGVTWPRDGVLTRDVESKGIDAFVLMTEAAPADRIAQ